MRKNVWKHELQRILFLYNIQQYHSIFWSFKTQNIIRQPDQLTPLENKAVETVKIQKKKSIASFANCVVLRQREAHSPCSFASDAKINNAKFIHTCASHSSRKIKSPFKFSTFAKKIWSTKIVSYISSCWSFVIRIYVLLYHLLPNQKAKTSFKLV